MFISMYLTQKIRIFPTLEQSQLLWVLSEKCRLIYNFALNERRDNWKANKDKPKEEKTYINYTFQQNQLPALKKEYPEYTWVYFSHKHPSKTPLVFQLGYTIPVDSVIKQVDIYLDPLKRWFVSITYQIEEQEYVDNGKYQAIDLGISNLVSAVNLDSKFVQIKNRRADLFWKKKLEEVQSKRDHCKKYSKKWKHYNQKFVSMKRKMSYQMKDFQHKISKPIVENTKANTIIVGDLNIKKMAKKKSTTKSPRQNKANKTLNHSMQNTGSMGRFVQFLSAT